MTPKKRYLNNSKDKVLKNFPKKDDSNNSKTKVL